MSDNTTENQSSSTTKNTSKTPFKIIIGFLILILIGAVVTAGFYLVKLHHTFINKEQALQEDIKTLHQNLAQQQSILEKFSHQQKAADDGALLTEVSYLIKTANLALLMENNVTQALNSLTTAKQYLVAKPEFTALNTAIDQDISALQTLATIDLNKNIAHLEKLLQQLANNDNNLVMPQTKNVTPPINNALPLWRKLLSSTLQELKNAVIIQHHPDFDASLLTNEQLTEANLNIQFRLLQAEWALMQRDPLLYHTALQSASNWLQKYFANRDSTSQLLKELQELQQINVQTKPNVKASLAALKKQLIVNN